MVGFVKKNRVIIKSEFIMVVYYEVGYVVVGIKMLGVNKV